MLSKTVRLNLYQQCIVKCALEEYKMTLEKVYSKEDSIYYVIKDTINEIDNIIKKLYKEDK